MPNSMSMRSKLNYTKISVKKKTPLVAILKKKKGMKDDNRDCKTA